MTPETLFSQTRRPGQIFFHPAKVYRPEPMAQAFMDTFPQAGWIDPKTRRHTTFKNLNPTDQRQALAAIGFYTESPTTVAKSALFRSFAKECQACLERKTNGRPTQTRAQTQLRQHLTQLAETIGIHPNTANVEPDEWHYN